MLLVVEYVQQLFMKREFKCWRHQLKDIKILWRSIKGSIKEDKVMNITNFAVSSLGEKDQIWFVLIWR
ncbi:unnamed protein product [Linum tenue]|uniref:Uncharacterized protein n=1 Tax=Linum tenue TaxID=586396 RepID=A0AAV0I2H8_9ROSI|nr:unnamed protein product [Linum tenue]